MNAARPPRPPRRWLDASDAIEERDGASPLERDLLRSAPSVDPPAGAQGRVWAAVLTKLPPLSGPLSKPPASPGDGGASAGGNASAAGKAAVAAKGAGAIGAIGVGAGLLKSVLIGAGGAVALIAAYSAVAPPPRSEPVPRPVPVVVAPAVAFAPAGPIDAKAVRAPEPVASAAVLANANANAERHAPSEPRTTAGAGSVEAVPAPAVVERERETMLREEGRQIGEARDSLRRGDAAGALVQLEQIRARFPGGALAQEREALAIEALARSGQRAAASARATAFLQAYPTSTLAERVQGFAK